MKKIFLIIFLVFFLFLVFGQVRAAGLVPCGEKGNPCQLCHIFVMFDNIIDFLLVPCQFNHYIPIVFTIALIMIVVGGLMYFFSGASPAMLETAKKILTSVVLGLLIIYSAWLIVNLFFSLIGVQEWTGLKEWWKINCP